MSTLSKLELESLYNSGKSFKEISDIANISPHKIIYLAKKYEIKSRTRSEAAYRKQNPNGDPFKISYPQINKDLLYGLGLGLFWREGNKLNKFGLRVANSNPAVIRLFRTFLIESFSVKIDKFGYSLVCFNNSIKSEVLNYWSRELNIIPEKFGKIVQVPPQGKGTYKNKSNLGVCTITFGNIKLKSFIDKQLEFLSIIGK